MSSAKNNTGAVVEIYTDGSCLQNPGPGGWAAVLIHPEKEKELSGGFALTTNNRMEMTAAVEALAELKAPCQVTLHTDSQYLQKGVSQWMAGWKKKGWRTASGTPVKNQDIWTKLDELIGRHKVRFVWVKGHAGDFYNERCDELAQAAARSGNLPPDKGYK